MSEIKEIIETLEPKIKGFKEELAADVAKLDSKLAADVAQLNEDAAKKSETLGELKAKVDAMAAKNGKPVRSTIMKVKYPPDIATEPCAKCAMPRIPKTTVKPNAIRI